MKTAQTKKKAETKRRYTTLWRNKFLTLEAKTIGDMIESLEGGARC